MEVCGRGTSVSTVSVVVVHTTQTLTRVSSVGERRSGGLGVVTRKEERHVRNVCFSFTGVDGHGGLPFSATRGEMVRPCIGTCGCSPLHETTVLTPLCLTDSWVCMSSEKLHAT